MGLLRCDIVFDNPYKTYYVGQTVSGHVRINLDKPKVVRGIALHFKGEVKTSWFEDKTSTNNDGKQESEQIEYSGLEEPFKISFYLIGSQGGGEIEIPEGSNTYPFTCMLPPSLPSSFEGDYGFVRYTVRAVLDRPWKFDHEIKDAFTVLTPYDLNTTPRLKETFRNETEKYFCCCWCKSGPLTFVVTTPFTGFVPGQVANLLCELDNISSVDVSKVQFSLDQVLVYHAQTPSKTSRKERKTIVDIIADPVVARESRTWHQLMSIPSLPPSNLPNCAIIELSYEIKIEAHVSGLHNNVVVEIPIHIGTSPLQMPSAPPEMGKGDSVTVNMDAQTQPAAQTDIGWQANNVYPDLTTLPAPTFEAAPFPPTFIRDKTDSDHVIYPNGQFSPMYPMYTFGQNTQNQNA